LNREILTRGAASAALMCDAIRFVKNNLIPAWPQPYPLICSHTISFPTLSLIELTTQEEQTVAACTVHAPCAWRRRLQRAP
jgi:hypothetical protein